MMQRSLGLYRMLTVEPKYLNIHQEGLKDSFSMNGITRVILEEGMPDQPLQRTVAHEETSRQPVTELQDTDNKHYA